MTRRPPLPNPSSARRQPAPVRWLCTAVTEIAGRLCVLFSLLFSAWAGDALPPAYKPLKESQVPGLLRAYDEWQIRLQRLAANAQVDRYPLAKAQHWLVCSRSELTDSDRGPLIEAAFNEATNLVIQLEAGQTDLPREPTIFPFVPSIRPELWDLVRQLKAQPNFATGQVAVAFLEVQLVWAAYHYKTLGWRAAKPTLEKAEEYALSACRAMQYQRQPSAANVSQTPARTTPGDRPLVLNLDALQDRLRELNARGLPLRSYAFAKAQHWLDFARAQDEAKDRSGMVTEGARQVLRIIQQLEAGNKEAIYEPPLGESVKKVREDLWALAESMKKHPAFPEVADQVAKLEVQLIWAGHEFGQLGWRTARPHIAAAERLAKELQKRLESAQNQPHSKS